MGQQTGISWTDHTFNPWWGCVKISPACTNCYAATFDRRVGGEHWGLSADRRFFGDKHWAEPLKWHVTAEKAGVRARVFCASMADVFEVSPRSDTHAWMAAARARLWSLIAQTPMLEWLLLTKRPENIRGLVPPAWLAQAPVNVRYGVTVESPEYYGRLDVLAEVPGRRFISYEPALAAVDLSNWLQAGLVDWVIAGGESGPRSRPAHPDWFRAVRNQETVYLTHGQGGRRL